MRTSQSITFIFDAYKTILESHGYGNTYRDQGVPARFLLLSVLPTTSTVRARGDATADEVDISSDIAGR